MIIKKPYTKPQIVSHGKLDDITQAGTTPNGGPLDGAFQNSSYKRDFPSIF